ncbi:hypothetical protein ACFLYQ_00990 [Chloroflexota bacterium]
MKGLLVSLLVVIIITAFGFGASIVLHLNLTEDMKTARESGLDEGYYDGYEKGLIEGSIAGYQDGSKLGYQTSSFASADSEDRQDYFFIYNPTYMEVQEILNQDELSSAQEVIDYSVINGIRAAYVRCQTIPNEPKGRIYLYEFVGFETVDKGFIVIDPELHLEIQVEQGKSYSTLNNLPAASHDDTMDKVTIVW